MAVPECINDEDEAAHCVSGVAHIPVELLFQQLEITVQQGDLNEVSSESVVDNCVPEEQEQADSPSKVELEIQITDAYHIGENEEVISASSHKLPSAESQGTDALLGFSLQRHHLIPIISESDQTISDSTREPHNVGNVFSPTLVTDTSDQLGRKVILKDIFLEYAVPHSLGDVLTLNVMRDDGSAQLSLERISNTKWKAVENIECDQNFGSMMLVASSMERGDEGFITLTEDEICAMTYVEEDTPVEHFFASVMEGCQVHIKISATIISCGTRIRSGKIIPEVQQQKSAMMEALHKILELQSRFDEKKDIEDINQVILLCKELMRISTGVPGLEDHHLISLMLGNAYFERFNLTGNLDDVDCTLSHHKKVVDSTPPDDANLPGRLNDLGNSYLGRFERTGDLADIDCAIFHHQKAVDSTPSGHSDLSGRLSNLGNSYSRRFERTGDLADIDCAILHHQKAVDLTPSGHTDFPGLLSNLGNSYSRRFERTRDLADIDCAISHHQKAVDSTPSGHSDLSGRSSNLGNSYLERFERTGDLADIHCAISHQQKAVDSTPSGHANLPTLFSNLGNSYLGRFERTGNLTDMGCAISYHKKSVYSTPSDHPDLPGRLNNLGNSYAARFSCNNNEIDIQRAIILYRHSAQSNGPPSVRLLTARLAALHSVVHDMSRCLLDFALAIGMLSEVAGLEQTIHRRYDNLCHHSDFVAFAASVAIMQSKPDLALEWLEQGRCMVWNQLNQLRTPVDNLRTIYPLLADQFISVASALESYGSRSVTPNRTSGSDLTEEIRLQNDAQKHTLHAIQYNKLLDKIRALPDFEDFLRPPKMTNILSSLPTDGPVIVFNIHELQCNALALISGIEDPVLIPLTNFSLDKAKKLLSTLRFDILKNREAENQDRAMPRRVNSSPTSMSYVLKELWYNVVQPVLEALGYSFDLSGHRRIWWCPSGPLTFLPLHAAGIYGSEYKPGSCISDYAVSSYTPTVQSLNEKFTASSASPRQPDILIINPNTPGLRPIPYTATESHGIKELFGESALLLEDTAATTNTVKDELKAHNWVHFACHGIQDTQDPLKSGVHLFDGRLELLDIMHQKLSNADFAFLSACQTSKGDAKLSEEVVHIAAGMLAAGYRGVVGTMWSISDQHGPQFSKHFYDYLFKEKVLDGLDSTKAAYALDYATRKVRETLGEGDNAFLIWVPYVHFGY